MSVQHARHFDALCALAVKDYISGYDEAADRFIQFRSAASYSRGGRKEPESGVDFVNEFVGGGGVVACGVEPYV